jgi:hypothetical protein
MAEFLTSQDRDLLNAMFFFPKVHGDGDKGTTNETTWQAALRGYPVHRISSRVVRAHSAFPPFSAPTIGLFQLHVAVSFVYFIFMLTTSKRRTAMAWDNTTIFVHPFG